MLFKTSLDRTAIGITIFITILFASIIGIQYGLNMSGSVSRTLLVTICLLLIYVLAFAFHPSAYKITGDELIICRPFLNVCIKRTDIKSVALVDKKQISGSIKTFGVGGLFGYYGCFANFTLGSMTWYATRKDNTVLITSTSNKKIVVTPNEPEAFVLALSA